MTSGHPENNRQRDFPPAPSALEVHNVRPDKQLSEYNVAAIISVCCGILGLVVLQVALAPLAIVFGALGVHNAPKTLPSTRGLAIAGYVLGIVDGIVWLILASVFQITSYPL